MATGDLWTTDEECDLVNLYRELRRSQRALGHRKTVEEVAKKMDRLPGAIEHRLERLTIWIDGHQLLQEPGTASFQCLSCEDWWWLPRSAAVRIRSARRLPIRCSAPAKRGVTANG